MTKRSPYDEEYDYDDDDFEDSRKGPRRFKKEDRQDKRKNWDRESSYENNHDDERR